MGKIISIRFKDTPEEQEASRALMEAFRENECNRLCVVCGQRRAVLILGPDDQWRCEHHHALMRQQMQETGATQPTLFGDEPRQERLIP
jgi:hypothetical protein